MKLLLASFSIPALIAASLLPAQAADKPITVETVRGHWEGVLAVTPKIQLRITLKLDKSSEGKLSGTWASPDQSPDRLGFKSIELSGETIRFATKIGASYEGTIKANSEKIKGNWTQSGRSFPLEFKRVDPTKQAQIPKALEGLWEGKLTVPGGITLRIVLVVQKDKDGQLTAHLASPDQGANNIPISQLTVKDNEVDLTVPSIGASFHGTRNAAGKALDGKFEQGGLKLPLVLEKTEKLSVISRPQTPQPPFPYRTEDVSYENPAGKVKLAGTLSLPSATSPVAAVLLITGSGAQDRDESILGHKLFLVIADSLTRRGIAVLRVDDRGVGGSTGSVDQSTSQDFAGDVLAGIDYLAKRKEIDPKKIGLIGHSEGGIIAPIVASRSKNVAFIVLMAGTGLPGAEILEAQAQLILKASGASEAALSFNREFHKQLQSILAQDKNLESAGPKLAAALKDNFAKLPAEEREQMGDAESLLSASLQRITTPWFRSFLGFDPRPSLRLVKCPVLAINGAKDLQVPPKENLAEIEKALRSSGNSQVKIVEFPGLNHLFQPCSTGSPSEYAAIETTIAPEVLKTIGDWISSQAFAVNP